MREFWWFLLLVEKIVQVQRIIPGRIQRNQSWSSALRISFSYTTITGLKYNVCKGGTGQELFIIIEKGSQDLVIREIEKIIANIL